ncbi:phosphate ABC transporter substrate-binding protein [Gimesia sp.]|uniref:phosphate ABC transporter substrate-binding protein n=1 Tax=Gimesia sp. TaxID=2024833 RepID=UPI003A95BEB6
MKPLFLFVAVMVLSVTDCLSAEKPQPASEQSLLQRDIVGLWLMGQSLCEGAESLPVVTHSDADWGNLMFQRGVRTWSYGKYCDKPHERPAEQFSLVPLKATVNGGLGETIANGLADHLKFSLTAAQQDVNQRQKKTPHFLVTYAGQGGRMIDELSSVDQSTDPRTPESRQHGGGYYRTSLDDARRATAQAAARGETFGIAALVWMQGEGNAGPTGGINPSRWGQEIPRPAGLHWYRDRLIEFRKQWSHDLQKITGQTAEIPLFTYQTLSTAGEAQLMAADLDPHITLVGPHYMVASALNSRYAGRYGDPIHLSADGERWFGEQVAKVMHRVLKLGESWQPLRPLNAWVSQDRASVLVDFHVPRPPLVLDETFLPREQLIRGEGYHSLYGFQVRSSTQAVSAIKAIELESPARLRIQLVSPLEAGTQFTLSYGLPYAGELGSITQIRTGPVIEGQPTTELILNQKFNPQLKPLLAEGAFFVSNMQGGEAYAQAPIRHVAEGEGKTVLRFENRELRKNTPFETGQTLTAYRGFSFGNLRDSDPEQAVYSFADPGYGTRAGEPYPLWNWCVLFKQFPISDQREEKPSPKQ